MRHVIILAAGLTLVATSAFSQGYSRDRDDSNSGGWHERRGDWDRGQSSDDRPGRGMRADDNDRGGDSSGSGSRFFLRSGDAQLRVICGDRESTRACVDAALLMFDRIQSQQGSSPRTPTPPNAPP